MVCWFFIEWSVEMKVCSARIENRRAGCEAPACEILHSVRGGGRKRPALRQMITSCEFAEHWHKFNHVLHGTSRTPSPTIIVRCIPAAGVGVLDDPRRAASDVCQSPANLDYLTILSSRACRGILAAQKKRTSSLTPAALPRSFEIGRAHV